MRTIVKVLFCCIWLSVINSCVSSITQSMYSELSRKENIYPKAESCGECHVDIYREWQNSSHARAFTSPHYKESTNDYKFEQCLSCHIPDSIFDEAIKTRDVHRAEGITCATCHLKQGKYVGPLEESAIIQPHPVEINTSLYYSSELCGKCHQGTWQEWKKVKNKEKNTCQQCHMKEVVRKVTQATDFISGIVVKFEEEGKLRRHRFHLEEIENLKGAMDITLTKVEKTEQKITIKLNLINKIPHNIPSGNFGFRKAVLQVKALDQNNAELKTVTREYYKELGNALIADSSREEVFELPAQTSFVEIFLQRKNRTESLNIFSKRMALP